MTSEQASKLMGFRGLVDITLLDDDDKPRQFQLRAIKMRDVSAILELVGDEDIKTIQSRKAEEIKTKEMNAMITTVTEVSKGMLMRTFPDELDEDLAEAIVMRNLDAFMDSIFKQVERMLPKERKLKRRPQGHGIKVKDGKPSGSLPAAGADKEEGKEGA